MPEIGKFYFAWLTSPAEVFDPVLHAREDEDIAAYTLSESEGEAARLVAKMRLPSGGLISGRRNHRWALVSIEVDGVVRPWFRGRVVSFPVGGKGSLAQIEFVGKPMTAQALVDGYVAGRKGYSTWDDLLVAPEQRDDADEIMSGRATTLHWHRATHALKESDLIVGGRLVDVGANLIADPEVAAVQPALDQINVTVECEYEQSQVGVVNIGQAIVASPPPSGFGGSLQTYSPDELDRAWTGAGSNLGGAYEIVASSVAPDSLFDHTTVRVSTSHFPTGDSANDDVVQQRDIKYKCQRMKYLMYARATYVQKRRETVKMNIRSLLQPIVTDSDMEGYQAARAEEMYFRLEDVQPVIGQTTTITYQGGKAEAPIYVSEDHKVCPRPSFFTAGGGLSSRGRQVLTAAASRAHAKLVRAARCIEISAQPMFDRVWDLTCDDSLRIECEYLPGGECRGKVVGYELTVDGPSRLAASVRIACCVGLADKAATVPVVHVLNPQPFVIQQPVDVDEISSAPQYLIESVQVVNGIYKQRDLLQAYVPGTTPLPEQILAANPLEISVRMKDLSAQDELQATIDVPVSYIQLPAQIDTAAEVDE